jgi:hypothetical protein
MTRLPLRTIDDAPEAAQEPPLGHRSDFGETAICAGRSYRVSAAVRASLMRERNRTQK